MKMSFLKDLRPATSMVAKSLTISDLKLYRWSRVTVRFRPNRLTVADEPCQQLSLTGKRSVISRCGELVVIRMVRYKYVLGKLGDSILTLLL